MKSINKLAFAALIALILVFAACSSPAGAGLGDGGPRVVEYPYFEITTPSFIAGLGQSISIQYRVKYEEGDPWSFFYYDYPEVYFEEHPEGITIPVYHSDLFIGDTTVKVWSLERRIANVEEAGRENGKTLHVFTDETIHQSVTIDRPIKLVDTALYYEKTRAPYKITLVGNGSLFTIEQNGLLDVEDVDLVGHSGNNAPLITIKNQGQFDMRGTVISDNENSTGNGGGVYVNRGGKFNMQGGYAYHRGTIRDNWAVIGGGVYVAAGGSLVNGWNVDFENNHIYADDPENMMSDCYEEE
jgi:hypothetical protein